jgi:hypothetical protein
METAMRKRPGVPVLVVLMTVLTASDLNAQSGAPPSAQQAAGGAIGRLTMAQELWRFEAERNRRLYNPLIIDGEARFGEERMNLARRVVDLMDARQCDEARELASEAGELTMAQRVRRWCRSGIYRYHGRVATSG